MELTEAGTRNVKHWTTFTREIPIDVLADVAIVASTRKSTIRIRFDTFVNICKRKVVKRSLGECKD